MHELGARRDDIPVEVEARVFGTAVRLIEVDLVLPAIFDFVLAQFLLLCFFGSGKTA